MLLSDGSSALAELGKLLGKPACSDLDVSEQGPEGDTRPVYDDPKKYSGVQLTSVDDRSIWKVRPQDGAARSNRPLRDDAAYRLPHRDLLKRPPAELTELIAAGEPQEVIDAYVRRSADLTMKGGITSGVIYPLAVCEIARDFRLRNIGGASAGAIAAAAAAAAERGRQSDPVDAKEPVPQAGDPTRGHVRRGFAGLADLVAFLTQIDDSDDARDQYRLAQLFRPTRKAASLFRLLVAFMRRRIGVIPVLLASAFGWMSKVATALLLAVACALAGAAARSGGWSGGRESLWSEPFAALAWVLAPIEGLIGIVGLGLTVVGLILLPAAAWNRRRPPVAELAEPVPRPQPTDGRRRIGVRAGILLLGVSLLAVAIGLFGVHWWVLLAVAAWLLLAQIIVTGISVVAFALRAKGSAFGLIAGASSSRRRSFWDRAAGVPKDRVLRSLMDWLSQSYSELAGIPGQVLRFGHLWAADYQPDENLASDRKAYVEPGSRLVNLELITTELVHGQSYKLPLLAREDFKHAYGFDLYIRMSDLEGDGDPLLPGDVINVFRNGKRPDNKVHDVATNEEIDDLRLLPEPADLPVIFAVRLSLSFPALFRAVRLYRVLDEPLQVRDDLGGQISVDGKPRTYPQSTEDVLWAEELWFSDGGITSNFPAHLFDSLLPRWPTFGINLDSYPAGFAHQDVWLPLDWQTRVAFGPPVRRGLVGFLLAIVNTARTWRDNAQMVMPSYRGRIASVRQRSSEGGSNLFMKRETIAELAVRGSFAGMRLRRRFRDDAMWDRHLWLRFRGAMHNLHETGARVNGAAAVGLYGRLRTPDAAAVFDQLPASAKADPDLPGENAWFKPDADYFASTGELLGALPGVAPNPKDVIPVPKPELRQVPFV
jgi:predicted acylesterase/phospholipase RssA